MRTAVVFTGAMRSFEKCLPTQAWHVFEKLGTPDFFVSTVADADAGKASLLVDRYGADRVKIDVVADQPDCIAELRARGCVLPGEWQKGKPYTHEPYAISVHPQAVARQLWQLNRAAEVFNLSIYDRVIRIRPDLWFHSCDSALDVEPDVCRAPWWGRFGGMNDRFAVMGREAVVPYFCTYSAIPALLLRGCPLHPESLVKASVELRGCLVRSRLLASFSTLRTTGEMRGPEVLNDDLAAICSS